MRKQHELPVRLTSLYVRIPKTPRTEPGKNDLHYCQRTTASGDCRLHPAGAERSWFGNEISGWAVRLCVSKRNKRTAGPVSPAARRRLLRTQQRAIPNIDLYCGGSNLCLCAAGRTLSESTTVDQVVNEHSQVTQFGEYFVSLPATHQILSVCGRNQYRCYSNEPDETAPHGQSSFPLMFFPILEHSSVADSQGFFCRRIAVALTVA